MAGDVERLLASLGAEPRWAPDGPGDVRVEAALVEATIASFRSDLRALAAELRSALADQRDRGASSYEVAGRVLAVADLLDPSPAQPEQTPEQRRQVSGQSLPSDLGVQPEAGSSNP